MSDYQLHSEDEHAYTIIDPSGKTFQVAKAGLQKGIHTRIKKMAQGGVVEKKKLHPSDDFGYIAQSLGLDSDTRQERFEKEQASLPRENTEAELNRTIASNSQHPTPPEGLVYPQPTHTTSQIPSTSELTQQPANATTSQPKKPTPSLLDQYNEIESMQESGIKGLYKAQADQARQTANMYAVAQQERELKAQEFAKKRLAIDQEYDEKFKAYNEGKINPNKVYQEMKTGNKILAGISIILGGVGAGLSGQPNLALKILEDATLKDIEAQKEYLNKTGNLLSLNMQRYRDLSAAESATYLEMNTALQAQIAKAAAQSGSEIALNQGKMAIGELKKSAIPAKQQLLQHQMVASLSGGNSQGNINQELLPAEVRERAVNVSNESGKAKLALAPTKEAAAKYREIKTETDMLKSETAHLIKLRQKIGASLNPFGKDYSDLESPSSSIITTLGKLHGLNTLNDNELKMYEKMVPPPYEMNSEKAIAKLMYLQKVINLKAEKAANNLLENYNPGNIKESPPVK